MKLETDRRAIEKRILHLEDNIAKLKRQRQTQRNRRQQSQSPVVALVGYTNAGKSTLMNALTGADAVVEDKLFATLDPLTRRGRLPSGLEVAFIDTVGFINRLPTQLAAAFRATLEEVQYADILLHVVDASSPNANEEIRVTEGVLKDLGAGATPTITVWNKIDMIEGAEPGFYEQRRRPSAAISALKGEGINRLQSAVEELINQARPQIWLRIDYKDYSAVHEIETGATCHKMLHRNEGIFILASLPPTLLKKYGDRLHPDGPPPVEA
jgi:GTP-binding protein HflX